MKLFISGWAGFREALGVIPEEWNFICPFVELDEAEILNFLENKSGEIVVGWSTGGHIVLKHLNFFSERFKKIIVIAGFKRFTDYVSAKVLQRMILKIKVEPHRVVRDFLINAGCDALIPSDLDYNRLIQGLNFLISSEINDVFCEPVNLVVIHGIDDKILPVKAVDDLKKLFPFAKTLKVKRQHWITFEEIIKIEASDFI